MVDLRKSLLLLVAFAVFASVAFAQPSVLGTTCVTTAVTPAVRAEGLTELIGDIRIECSGGTPTTPGEIVPRVNIVLFTNGTVTSKILASSALGDYTESLLLVDEPTVSGNRASSGTYKGVQRPCPDDGSFDITLNYCVVRAQNSDAVSDVAGLPAQAATYDGTSGHPNVFQGRLTQGANQTTPANLLNASSVGFFGVPFDPPGTNWVRTFHITNVRIDATQYPVTTNTLPVNVQVSINGSQSISLNNNVLTAGYVQQSLAFDTVGNSSFLQCEPPADNCPSFVVRFKELIPGAFKLKDNGLGIQADPGQLTDNETGFWNPNFSDSIIRPARGDLGLAGHATQATRLLAKFANIPSGIDISVTLLGKRTDGLGPLQAGLLKTSVVDSNGDGATDWAVPSAVTPSVCSSIAGVSWTNMDLGALPISGGATSATWQITEADPSNIQALSFGVTVRYHTDTVPAISDPLNPTSVEGHFAPLSQIHYATYGTGEGNSGNGRISARYPRFVPSQDTQQSGLFTIGRCQTNLLFPFVTNYPARFDTGFAVSNTSMDPFTGNREQEGPVHIYYYGTINNDPTIALPSVDNTAVVPAGKFITWSLSGGGSNPDYLIDAAPGFAGYVIVKCDFQYAHGYAYISDLGAENFAQGYVALVMDASLYANKIDHAGYEPLTRTGVRSEHLDQ